MELVRTTWTSERRHWIGCRDGILNGVDDAVMQIAATAILFGHLFKGIEKALILQRKSYAFALQYQRFQRVITALLRRNNYDACFVLSNDGMNDTVDGGGGGGAESEDVLHELCEATAPCQPLVSSAL